MLWRGVKTARGDPRQRDPFLYVSLSRSLTLTAPVASYIVNEPLLEYICKPPHSSAHVSTPMHQATCAFQRVCSPSSCDMSCWAAVIVS